MDINYLRSLDIRQLWADEMNGLVPAGTYAKALPKRPYWTPAERAGLKAMGGLLKESRERFPTSYIMEKDNYSDSIRAFVSSARAQKEKER